MFRFCKKYDKKCTTELCSVNDFFSNRKHEIIVDRNSPCLDFIKCSSLLPLVICFLYFAYILAWSMNDSSAVRLRVLSLKKKILIFYLQPFIRVFFFP